MRALRGAFCTGITCFPQTDGLFFSETLHREFMEEMKVAHKLKKPSGPGRVQMRDWTKERREFANIPVVGTEIARPIATSRPPRNAYCSSSDYGRWWHNRETFLKARSAIENPS